MKLRWHIFVFLALFFLLGKVFLFAHLEFAGSRPDLLLILVIYIALSVSSSQAMIAGWILGVLRDFASGDQCGIFAFFYLLGVIFVVKFKEEIFAENKLLPTIFSFFLSLQCNFFHAVFLFLLYGADFFLTSLCCALYTALMTPLVVVLLEQLSLVSPCKKP